MKKLLSLMKANMFNNMNLFSIKTKNNSKLKKLLIPIILALVLVFYIMTFADSIMKELNKVHFEFVLLSLFVFITFILITVEGIYKSGSLLFNCRDDDFLLSLPIKKSTVLFIRIFKFYIFELLYTMIFLVPAIIVYAKYVDVGFSYYILSFIFVLLAPIIPIILSCILGTLIVAISSRFKYKNVAQIIVTMICLLGVFYISYRFDDLFKHIAAHATSINDLITKIYYPAGIFVRLVTDFKISDLLVFILVNIGLLAILIFVLSKIYFKINTRTKMVKHSSRSSNKYKIKVNKPMKSLVKKELKRFFSSPVFVTNAAFGLVLFLVACITIIVKFDSLSTLFQIKNLSLEKLRLYFPLVLFGLITFTSFMSSLTCSMISLEGKSINVLKGLPLKASTIIISKVLTAVLVIIPVILVGDISLFISMKFTLFQMIIIIISSVVLPITSQLLGILVNLKYPKMDYENPADVIKRSMSSTVAVLIGMLISIFTIVIVIKLLSLDISITLVLLCCLFSCILVLILLLLILYKWGVKKFNSINV